MFKEQHHTLPVALGGPDIKQNMMELSTRVHREVLHRTLDVDGKIYRKRQRKYKKKQNDKLVLQPDSIDMIREMQHRFLENLNKLPARLQEKHVKVMMGLSSLERLRYYKMTQTQFDEPELGKTDYDRTINLHNNYMECKKETANEIIATLKRNFYTK